MKLSRSDRSGASAGTLEQYHMLEPEVIIPINKKKEIKQINKNDNTHTHARTRARAHTHTHTHTHTHIK